MITESYSAMGRDRDIDRERELSMYRSGSAPPMVEGSLSAAVGLPEDEMRSDPAYISYYYANVNQNPRLPPPVLSKEDWQFAQRRVVGPEREAGGERRREERESLLFGGENERQWGGDGLIGLPGLGLVSKHKRLAEIFQDDTTHGAPFPGHHSRPVSRNAFEKGVENCVTPTSQTYASAFGATLSRNTTPDPLLTLRSSSPRIPPVGDKRPNSNGIRNIHRTDPADVAAALSAMSLNPNMIDEDHNLLQLQADKNHLKQQPFLNRSGSGQYQMQSASDAYLKGSNSFRNYGYSGYPAASPISSSLMGNQALTLPPLFDNLVKASALGADTSLIDPLHLQHMRENDPMMDYDVCSYMDLLRLENAYREQVLSPHKLQYMNNYYGNSTLGIDMAYPGSPVRYGERSMRHPSQLKSFGTGGMGSWQNMDGHFASTLLDEFKSNKTKCFELSEIAGHVVEFSADQYGSRFIQQKLETATLEEKNMVFNEINLQALPLMTDVFGNYVIQKFFEHGTPAQIRAFAGQLIGHVLTLSLQMYGCRVIQKAIEVVELDQQIKMVAELDGHIMKCVRDQNGNHVIQKCIECVPEEVIQFIISIFYGQVVTLSTHPYGCRVIQRVLEYCANPKTLQIVMDEIMQSVVMLAQDQYGNYVIQHVMEHGKPHERSAIIKQLIGQILQMSQQKYASNVVEKCLSFGTPEERQILVDEMLGCNDGNDPLQVMMKDQFANYVVQKVLETCDDQQLELILNRIKVHLCALKKYTYGKHIVTRVEKLVAAGEKRISSLAAAYSA